MPRNDTGQYTLPIDGFVPFTRILNTAVNSDLLDIANNITQSMPPNGVVPMTGPLRLQAGTITDLALRFENDPDNGFYTSDAVGQILAIVNSGAHTGTITSEGIALWSNTHTFSEDGFFVGEVVADSLEVATTWEINGREVTSFAQSVHIPFYNAAAPTGWTKFIGANDFTLRIVPIGGGAHGVLGWSVVAAKTTFDNASFDLNVHNHTFTAATGTSGATLVPIALGTNAGATAIPCDSSGTTSSHNHILPMTVAYLDTILCGKN